MVGPRNTETLAQYWGETRSISLGLTANFFISYHQCVFVKSEKLAKMREKAEENWNWKKGQTEKAEK